MTTSLADELATLLAALPSDPEPILARLEPLYDEQMIFRDPIQTLHGRDAFMAMNRSLVRRMRELRFDVTASAERGPHVFLAWTMTVASKRGPRMVIDGTTHCESRDGRIVMHRDHWDLLGGFMDSIPFARTVYRAAVAQIG